LPRTFSFYFGEDRAILARTVRAVASEHQRRAALASAVSRAFSNGVWPDVLSVACLALLCVVMIVTLGDYGLTYDEEPHIRYGERVLAFFASGFKATAGVERSSYGAAFDVAAALLRRVSPWDEYRTNHVLCAFVAQVGLLGTWRLGRLLAGPLGGLLSLLFLVLTPVYYGHQFNNPKDIPFAAGYVWGLYFIARLVGACAPASAEPPLATLGGHRFWLALAAALGLGMSVRVGGAILIGYLVLFLALVTLERWRVSRAPALASLRALAPLGVRALGAILGGWALVILSWPRAFTRPLDGPRTALETVSNYTAYDSPTLLRGRLISSQKVPWDYLPTYFAVQLPELTLLCFVGACAAVVVVSVQALRRRRPMPLMWLLLVTAVLVPPAYAIVRHSTLYNGLRHFLFIIPPLAVLAGGGMAVLARWAARRQPLAAAALAALMLLFTVDQAAASWRLHPHQHVFFNRWSGGLARAVDRYETEYYGSVYRELADRLVETVWQTRRDEYLNRTFVVAGCGSNLFFKRNLPQNFQYAAMRGVNHADYYATYARDGCLKRLRDRELVTSVTREGAHIAVARDMKHKIRRGAAAAR
jgi:hypothetical protein